MTKLETAKALDNTGAQLQVVEALRAMRQDLDDLPAAIAGETAGALEPLRSGIDQALATYDQVTATQRQALDEMATEISRATVQRMEAPAAALTTAAASVTKEGQQLRTAAGEMSRAAPALATQLHAMETAANRMVSQADEIRPPLWRRLAAMIAVGMVAAGLVGIGQVGFERLLPPPSASASDDERLWRAVWSQATAEERELIRQIVNRPAK